MLNFFFMFLRTQTYSSIFPLVCYLFFTLFVTSNEAVRSHDMIVPGQKLVPDAKLLNAANHPNTLVLVGTKEFRDNHKDFFKSLLKDGHHLTFHEVFESTSKVPSLVKQEVPLYHNILLGDITSSRTITDGGFMKKLAYFLEHQSGNIFILGGSSDFFKTTFFKYLGISIISEDYVFDPFHCYQNNSRRVIARKIEDNGANLFSSYIMQKGVIFEGFTIKVNKPNVLFFPLLKSEPTTFVNTSDSSNSFQPAENTLILGFQSRTNARLTVIASNTFCSDEISQISPTNHDFCRELAQWVFKQRGVIDWSNLRHFSNRTQQEESQYIVNEAITITLQLHEIKKEETEEQLSSFIWKPVNEKIETSVQIEQRMLVLYWRLFMKRILKKSVTDSTTLSVSFNCPSYHGIYKAVIYLTLKGYTFLHLETITAVRTRLHDDYERFSWNVSPYYASMFVSFTFSLLLIFLLMSKKK